MMKFLSLLFFWSLLPSLSLACSCSGPPDINATLYENPSSIVLEGRNIEQLKLTTKDENGNHNVYYAFKVKWVHKAPCYIQKDDVIMVSTGGNSGLCGVNLKPNTRYTFEAYALNSNPLEAPAIVQVGVGSCSYLVEGDVPVGDRQILRAYSKANPHIAKCTNSTSL
jgi:hypothetical protein